MHHQLPRSAVLALATILPQAIGCGGKVEYLGVSKIQLVQSADVSGTVPACASGAAHRNACCTTSGSNTECGVFPDEPFHPCDSDWQTYPDPHSCCDLTDPSHPCGPPPAQPSPLPPGKCSYGCPPGWHANGSITAASGSCCSSSSGASTCFGWGGGNGTSSSSTCDYVCPAGWQPLTPGSPEICCRSQGAGVECFSQATGPGGGGTLTWTCAQDGATTATTSAATGVCSSPATLEVFWTNTCHFPVSFSSCGGGGTGPGSALQCGCNSTVGGHNYALTCSSP
jgi:hypothetical protein